MDEPFPQDESAMQPPTSFFVSLPAVDQLFKWLASLIEQPKKSIRNKR
jgi:hypothetical protein